MKKIRRLFILVVLLANIFIIALPIIKKFLDDGIMIEVSTKQENGLLPPTISVCRRSSDLYVFFDFSLHDQSSLVGTILRTVGRITSNVSTNQK